MSDTTTISNRNLDKQKDLTSSNKRLCWVCLGIEQDDENSDVVWVYPCQCKGSLKWVHEECLQRWIDEKLKTTNSPRVSCSLCKTYYILSFPPVNRLVRLMERYDKLLYGSSPYLALSAVVGSVYWCCGSYGFVSIIQVMGFEEGKRVIDDADPLLLVIGLPVIPITLILAKLIKWEDFILRLWRRSAFKLPKPLSYIMEEPPAEPRVNCDQMLFDPGFNEPLACTRMICGALLLPTVSALVGKLFFSQMSGSQWRRSLVGGFAFLLFKGLMKIYLRKAQYVRYSQRTIKNHVSFVESNQTTRSLSIDGDSSYSNDIDLRGSLNDSSGGENAGNDNEILNDNLVQDDTDDDNVQPRTVFSMTIRL